MNLKAALKRKNKLTQLMNEEYNKFRTYNSVLQGETRTYDAKEAFDNWIKYQNELIDLKCKIHQANIPMYRNIFGLSELKDKIVKLKQVYPNEGKHSKYNPQGENIEIPWENMMSTVERDLLIKQTEDRIEQIQDELDEFNVKTLI